MSIIESLKNNDDNWVKDTPDVRYKNNKILTVRKGNMASDFIMHVVDKDENGNRKDGYVQVWLEPLSN